MRIGIDIGGTSIAAGVVGNDRRIIARDRILVSEKIPDTGLVSGIKQLIDKLLTENNIKEIENIGIGVPGSFNNRTGEIVYTSNLAFKNTPIVKMLKEVYNVPVYLENDANCAAIGELQFLDEGTDDVIVLVIGTGIGGGIITGGKIYRGFNSAAGEVGHMVIKHGGRPCNCGRCGCWERYASATGLIISTIEKIKNSPESIMRKLTDTAKITGKTAFDAAKLGDTAAIEVVNEYIEYLACGIVNLIHILEPQIILIGGGISNEPEQWLLKPLNIAVARDTLKHGFGNTAIRKAKLGADAGIIGAAMLGTGYI